MSAKFVIKRLKALNTVKLETPGYVLLCSEV